MPDQPDYDVIVIGAGPAGAQLTRYLANRKFKVLLIEKQKEIGEPNFSTAGTIRQTLKDFDLPHTQVAPYFWNQLYVETPNMTINKKLRRNSGWVFDFRKLKQWIVEDAVKKGATVYVSAEVTELFFKDGEIAGVECHGPMFSGRISSKMVVDATGGGTFAYKLGLANPDDKEIAVGVELEMANTDLPQKNTLFFYLGDDYVPNGYGWVFPLTDNISKIGVARYLAFSKKDLNLEDCLNNFIKKIPWLSECQPLEMHGGSIIFNPKFNNYVTDNFMVIGSAAAQVNPLGGEGIRHALWAAKFASKTIEKSLRKRDTSKKRLSEFNKIWLKYSNNNWSESYRLTHIIYGDTDNNIVSRNLSFFQKFSGDELFDMLFFYNFRKYSGRFAKSIGLASKNKVLGLVKNIFNRKK